MTRNDPDSDPAARVMALFNAALQQHRAGRLDAAAELYGEILALAPDLAEVHNNLGDVRRGQGRWAEAAECYRRALARQPGLAVAQNNLGLTLRALGRPEEAAACHAAALALQSDFLDAAYHLATLLQVLGRFDEALPYFRQLIAAAPHIDAFRCAYGELLTRLRTSQADPALRDDLARALEEAWIAPVQLVGAVAPLLLADPDLAGEPEPAALARLAENRLLIALLTQTLAADEALEEAVARLRQAMLDAYAANRLPDTPALRGLAAALAHHAFTNEYASAETQAETARVETLRATIDRTPAELALLLLAAYRPLGQMGLRIAPGSPALQAVIRRQIDEPAEEARLGAAIPRLTDIDEAVSRAVQAQYEENPYPRWTRHPLLRPARPAAAVIGAAFPHADLSALRPDVPTEILVAGCGTGQHPCLTARSYAPCRVLAVDLSHASLAYARRKAAEHGIDNIAFAQADILALGALDRRFDIIESVGVLHHMRAPLDGWAVLVDRLRPGGLMKIGLYGEVKRAGVVAARDFIRRRGFLPTTEGIRACRQAILAMPEDAPARQVVAHPDFYSTSSCRDLIFHVQEHRYVLPDIAAAIERLGLRFIGFDPNIGNALRRRYAERFPANPAMTDLAHWQDIEAEAPDRLPYLFWVQKPR